MRKWFHGPVVLALVFGATALFAQDSPKKEPTGGEKLWTAIHEQCCPKAGKCEGKDKETCDHVRDTVMAIGAKCAEKAQKEGIKCEECAKAKECASCQGCRDLTIKTIVPLLKKQASTANATHTLPTADGKTETVKCTLTSGPVCKGCVEEMSNALIKACKEAAQKGAPKQ